LILSAALSILAHNDNERRRLGIRVVSMKKKNLLIAVAIVAVLLFAIYSAVLWDMASKRSPQTPSAAPVAAQPAPEARVQNLQAPPPAAIANPNDVKALIAKLADPDPAVRAQAQLALEKIGQPALAEIQNARLTHPDPEVRARCNELVFALLGAPRGNPPLAGGGANAPAPEMPTITERRTIVGMDGKVQIEEIVKDMAGNVLRRNIINAPAGGAAAVVPAAIAPAQPRRRMQIPIPPNADPQTRAALMQAQQAQDQAWAQLDAMRAQREARNRAAGGGGDFREGMALLQQLAGVGPAKLGEMPAPPPAEDRSLNLLASFGARLAETADGVRVLEVNPESPAGKAGLAVGDLINRVNGRQTATENDFKDAVSRAEGENKPLRLDVTRRGEELTLEAPRP
jgi:type IV secretory pathway VirB10-like protein